MTDQHQDEVTVHDNPAKSRFDVLVGDTHAGFSMYHDMADDRAHDAEPTSAPQRVFYHTVVFDDFAGRGLAGILTRAALETSIRAGHRIVPVCPYVKKWLTTHHDLDDAVDPVTPEHLNALG